MYNKNTKGYSVGGLVLLVVLLSAVAATFGKFNGAGKHGSSAGLRESSASMEAAVLLQQAAQLKEAAGSLVHSYTGPGSFGQSNTKLGIRDGVLAVDFQDGSPDSVYSQGFRMPNPSGSSELKSREWLIGTKPVNTGWPAYDIPVSYAVLQLNSPTVCREINRASGFNTLPIDPKSTPNSKEPFPTMTALTTAAGVTSLSFWDSYTLCTCWSNPMRCIFYVELYRA